MKKAVVVAFVMVLALAVVSAAEVETKFSGYQWLRYDYKVIGSWQDSAKDTNGFYVPRTYLKLKARDADRGYEGNIIIDINNSQYGQSVTGTGAAGTIDWAIWVKNGYITFFKIPFLQDIGMSVKAGIQPVYFGAVDTWAYPLLERALEDRYGAVGSADNGIAITGKFPENWGGYEVAAYNGGGYKKLEDNAEKAGLASVLVSPMPELYGRVSYYRNLTNAYGSPAQVFSATAAIAGFKFGPVDGFGEYLIKNSAKDAALAAGNSGTGEGYSAYINWQVINELALLVRYDSWNPDTRAALDEMNTYITGVNVVLAKETVMLQINYQLDQPKYKGTPDKENVNLWAAQVKWSW